MSSVVQFCVSQLCCGSRRTFETLVCNSSADLYILKSPSLLYLHLVSPAPSIDDF